MHDFFWNQQDFLSTYWQQKPWHGKNQLDVKNIDIAPTDLDLLCKQDEVTTRLIVQKDDVFSLDKPKWDAHSRQNRTLFIQEMDRWFPEVCALFDAFPIYPRWRFDDIMGSYSTKGSSSSAHVDFYDVFIVQVSGSKSWHVEKEKRSFENCKGEFLQAHKDLRIIKKMQAYDTFLLEPGDVLYVPTRFVHEAVAAEDSFSYSMGLRSPRIKDMVAGFDKERSLSIDEDLHMEEAHTYKNAFSIPKDMLSHVLNWPQNIEIPAAPTPPWFGKLVTTPHEDIPKQAYLSDILLEDQQALHIELDRIDVTWVIEPTCRMALQEVTNEGYDHLFIQGELIQMPTEAHAFVQQLITMKPWAPAELKEAFSQSAWTQQLWTYLCVNDLMWAQE